MSKKLIVCGCLMVAMSGLAGAAQIIIGNLNALHPIATPGGDLVPSGSGFAQLGAIDLTDAEVMGTNDRAALAAAFSEFGTSTQFGAGGSGGFFANVVDSPIAPGDSLIDKNIVIVAGDGADIGSSTGIWIFKSDLTYQADPFNATIRLSEALSMGTILKGAPTNVFVPLVGGNFDGSQMVALVPEPRVAMLAGVAAVMLIGVRRRS